MTVVTRILNLIDDGDPSAADQLLPLVYNELRKLATQRLANEKPGQTIQATALVHEAYLRLTGDGDGHEQNWNSRGHFFGAAAEAMRRILVENARRKKALKHGGGLNRVALHEADVAIAGPADELLELDEVLARFELKDPHKARLVKLRYFAGLTLEQAASAMNISRATAIRHWAYARAWLRVEIGHDADSIQTRKFSD